MMSVMIFKITSFLLHPKTLYSLGTLAHGKRKYILRFEKYILFKPKYILPLPYALS